MAQQAFSKSLFLRDVTIEIARQRSAKVEGGDRDDRTDKLTFTVTLQNRSKTPYAGVKMKFYLFAQNILFPKRFKLLQVYETSTDIDALKSAVLTTPLVETMWDDTVQTFGDKYKGWIAQFFAPDGTPLIEKSSSSFFTNTNKLSGLKEGNYYDKALQPVEKARY